MRDWCYTVCTGRYRAATGSFDYETALGEYRGDVLAISVDRDVYAPRAATEALLAKAPNASVTRRAYAASRGGKPCSAGRPPRVPRGYRRRPLFKE
jgi:predicted alpha/beta hydrolase